MSTMQQSLCATIAGAFLTVHLISPSGPFEQTLSRKIERMREPYRHYLILGISEAAQRGLHQLYSLFEPRLFLGHEPISVYPAQSAGTLRKEDAGP